MVVVIQKAGSALVSAIFVAAFLSVFFLTAPAASAADSSIESQITRAPVVRAVSQNPPSLDKPNMDTPAVLSWAAQAVTDIMTIRYDDYNRRLQRDSRNFTKTGWEHFAAAMQRLHILDQVQSLKRRAVAKLKAPPKLVHEGPSQGRYRWSVNIPLEMTYAHEKATHTATMSLDLVVERVSVSENGSGLSIASWDMTQLTGEQWIPPCPASKQ